MLRLSPRSLTRLCDLFDANTVHRNCDNELHSGHVTEKCNDICFTASICSGLVTFYYLKDLLKIGPYDLASAGSLFPHGPVLIGTARDETCSLEGREWSFELTESQFKIDTEDEYGTLSINVSKVADLYAGYHNTTVTRRRTFTNWWWAAI
eukprot:SAG31_NODE_3424_length_4291_cov_1.659113_1_plen_150_part_10